ncbi:DUF3800 domain-containing protein [Patescibacteria group bacterium]|nr:DUF3800 domain-containing protein [Patescibacteria group bacterium]MBU4511780.1 DUF3800 domain-containing protein [Patescibacteria group bacterium]
MQKLYCYVDESGQDTKSEIFVVVAVVSSKYQYQIRKQLLEVEELAKTHQLKWHKLRNDRRMKYLALILDRKIGSRDVYIGRYQKPIPFFFPMLDLVERAITQAAKGEYTARIYVDGINKKVAKSLTNALRSRGISLRLVKSRRDESEPLIRLADMWAGCIRSAFLNDKDSKSTFRQARERGYLQEVVP